MRLSPPTICEFDSNKINKNLGEVELPDKRRVSSIDRFLPLTDLLFKVREIITMLILIIKV